MAQAVQRLATKVPELVKACQRCTEPRLKEFLKYARVELAPPTAADLPAIQKGFSNLMTAAKTQKWQAVTVKEGFLNSLVAFEVLCWFFIGECIGKRSIVGYQVPGAVHFDAVI
ncbi:ATP synthase subunit g, mitochondrial [Lamellibrachia satsuma]|nr:ATP synthase subunit g, mitochondrial [Lamellibrachia satsuma]